MFSLALKFNATAYDKSPQSLVWPLCRQGFIKHIQMARRGLRPFSFLFNVFHALSEFIQGFESLARCNGIQVQAFQHLLDLRFRT